MRYAKSKGGIIKVMAILKIYIFKNPIIEFHKTPYNRDSN